MVVFMQNNPGSKTIEFFYMGFKIFVKVFNNNRFVTYNILSYFWNTEAALVIRPRLTFLFYNMGIDKNAFKAWPVRI